MIKPNELRIGNMIYPRNDCNEVVEVTDIDNFGRIGTTAFFYNNKGTADTTDASACGIPITPEWMEKLGFKNGLIHNFDKSIKISYYDGTAYIGNSTSTSGTHVQNIQYVHQFQNLYHSLTGEELTIKEKV